MYFFSFIFTLGLFIYLINNQSVKTKWSKLCDLNHFIYSRYKSIPYSLFVTCKTVTQIYWFEFTQWLNNSVRRIDRNHSIVTYSLSGKLYSFVVRTKRGPTDILVIFDENNNDITDRIMPFYEPNHDWHKKDFTPAFWNLKQLIFELSTGEQKVFNTNDVIEL
jgi:hypothetical protein